MTSWSGTVWAVPLFILSAAAGVGGFAAAAASNFSHGGKVTKRPFKGEMFRLISPLKIPLSATKKRAAAPFFDFSPGWVKNSKSFFYLGRREIVFHSGESLLLEKCSDNLSPPPGFSYPHRRVKPGHRSDPRRLAADLAIEAAASLEQRAPGRWKPVAH